MMRMKRLMRMVRIVGYRRERSCEDTGRASLLKPDQIMNTL